MPRKASIRVIFTLMVIQSKALQPVFGYKLFNRDVPNEDSFLTSVVGVSLDECISACGVRTSCNSVTYRRTAGYCRMYSTTDNYATAKLGVVYSQRDWWAQELPNPVCYVSCPESQNCGHVGGVTCHITECPSPSTEHTSDVLGNMRHIGAKLRFRCIEGGVANNDRSVVTCQSGGVWDAELACDLCGFKRIRVGYHTRMSGFVEDYYGAAVYTDTSRSECMSYCRNETRYCEALSFFPMNGTCILSDKSFQLVEATGWEVIAKIIPVVLYRGPNGHYSMTFVDAMDYCISQGTTMASYDDIALAYTMGYNIHSCGWVMEGYAYISLHHAIPGIFSFTGVNRCTWTSTWNVFCKNILFKV